MSFYVKFSGLRTKLRILKNIVLTSADIQRTDLWCANEAFRITNFTSKTKHFTALLFFLAVCNKKFQRVNAQPYAHDASTLSRDEHGTHKHAHSSWILCSVSRVRSKAMLPLFFINYFMLPYITLLYITTTSIRDFFCPWNYCARLY